MGEVIAIIGIMCCGIMFLYSMITEKWGGAFMFFLLFGVNAYGYKMHKEEEKVEKVEKWKTVECSKYTVDSTIVISGADTTKTYVINYLE